MMRVVNVIEDGRFGGPQKEILLVCSRLKRVIDCLVVVPPEGSDAFCKELQAEGIRSVRLNIVRIKKSIPELMWFVFTLPRDILRLRAFFRSQSVDIVHIRGGVSQFKGVLAAYLSGIKSVWTLNDTSMPFVVRQSFRLFSRFTNLVVCVAQKTKVYYVESLGLKLPTVIIEPPVDCQHYLPQSRAGRENQPIVVGTVANISPVKGIEFFVRMAAQLNKSSEKQRYQFLIVGNVFESQRSYYDSIVNLIAELEINNLSFIHGLVDSRTALQEFDIFVCSSVSEASPMSVWEAMSMKLPVVSSDVGDVSLHIQDGVSGYVVAPGNVSEFTSKVESLAKDPAKRVEMGETARRRVLEQFDLPHSVEKHLKMYESLAPQEEINS